MKFFMKKDIIDHMGEFGENPNRSGNEGKTSRVIRNFKTGFKNLTRSTRSEARPALEDQLKAKDMLHSTVDKERPTLESQIRDEQIEKVRKVFGEMGAMADQIESNWWNDLDQEIYDEAIKQGKVEFAKKYRQDRFKDHERYLKEKQKRQNK